MSHVNTLQDGWSPHPSTVRALPETRLASCDLSRFLRHSFKLLKKLSYRVEIKTQFSRSLYVDAVIPSHRPKRGVTKRIDSDAEMWLPSTTCPMANSARIGEDYGISLQKWCEHTSKWKSGTAEDCISIRRSWPDSAM